MVRAALSLLGYNEIILIGAGHNLKPHGGSAGARVNNVKETGINI